MVRLRAVVLLTGAVRLTGAVLLTGVVRRAVVRLTGAVLLIAAVPPVSAVLLRAAAGLRGPAPLLAVVVTIRRAGARRLPCRPAAACPPRAGPGGLTRPVFCTVLARPALATGQAGHRGDEQHPRDDGQGHPRAHVRHRHRPEMVDAVGQQRLADELDPDEPEDDGQPGRQVHQPVQQPAHEEIQVPQPKQREQVGGEDQERVAGEAEDRRDRIDGEQHVGHPDRDDQDEQRGGITASPHPGGQAAPLAPGRDRHEAAREPHRGAAAAPGRGASATERDPRGGIDEQRPEEVFHPGKLVQGRTAERDEHAAQHEGEQNPEQQNAAVVLACHPGTADQQDEHQQVVERQAVFGQPAGEELARRRPAASQGDQPTERHGQRDRRRRPQRRFAKPLRSTPAGADEKVTAQENGKGRDGRGPGPGGNVENAHGIRAPCVCPPAGRAGRRA
jgi:hypothetical protein